MEGVADSEFVSGDGDEVDASLREVYGVFERSDRLCGVLFEDAALFDHAEEWEGASVADWGFWAGEFDDEVVDFVGADSGENMFDGEDPDIADGDVCASGGIPDVLYGGGNFRLSGEVNATEDDSSVFFGRAEADGALFSGV